MASFNVSILFETPPSFEVQPCAFAIKYQGIAMAYAVATVVAFVGAIV